MEGSSSISNKEKNAYYINSAVGIVSGYAAYKYIPNFVKKHYAGYYLNKCNSIPASEHNQYWTYAKEAFSNSKFSNSDIEIVNIDKTNWKNIAVNIIEKRKQLLNNPVKKFLSKIFSVSDEALKNGIKTAAQGKNSCFIPITSQVLVNRDKKGITVFHEIGHAINEKSSGFKKILANSRAISVFALPSILCIGLLTPKRAEGDEPHNPIGKTTTFIKKHCGLLTGLSLLPVIAEEGVASINGAKLAKNVLTKEMYNKMNKIHAIALGSYVIGAATISICAGLAVHIKDLMTGTMPAKNKD